jgi:integrin beta 3
MPHDPEELAATVVRQVLAYVERELEPFRVRLLALETAPAPRDGRDGRDAKGIDGKDGADGKDGLGFDDLSVDYDGERRLVVKFTRGDNVREFPAVLPIVIDRGVFKDGESYERGDGVTWAGSFWIAREATFSKPGDDTTWRLAIKRGRDGKDAAK